MRWESIGQRDRGVIDLALRSDRVKRIFADVVYEKDKFEYSKGINSKLVHEDADEEDRGEIKYVYALAEFTNGGYVFDVWTKRRVDAHAKKYSPAYNSGPWKTDWEAMAKKTLVMAIWKYLPLSTNLQQAFASDGVARDFSRDIDAEIVDEKDVLNIAPITEPESEPENNGPILEKVEKGKTPSLADNLPASDENGSVEDPILSGEEVSF